MSLIFLYKSLRDLDDKEWVLQGLGTGGPSNNHLIVRHWLEVEKCCKLDLTPIMTDLEIVPIGVWFIDCLRPPSYSSIFFMMYILNFSKIFTYKLIHAIFCLTNVGTPVLDT